MKRSDLARLGAALYAAGVLSFALPGVVGAQTSGANPPPGVTSSTGLPRTGNPEATTTPPPAAPFVLIAGGVVVGLYALRRRWVHYVVPRKRQ
jgi:hypothetical protein